MTTPYKSATPPAAATTSTPPKDFASALDDLPSQVDAPKDDSEGGDLDAEQSDCAERMGFSPAEASALKQFIKSVR